VINDADAAGIAELHYGAAKGVQGLVILTTLGTGIGTAIIHDGRLVPNSELGHLEIDGYDAETRAASSIKEIEGLSWGEYVERLQVYYDTIEKLFSPDLIVVGGGISKDSDKFLPLLKLRCPIVPALLRNQAGIIGAAHLAVDRSKGKG
jgi:polyphosphate glucokinase